MLDKGLVNNFIEKIKEKIPCTISVINLDGAIISSTDINLMESKNQKSKVAIRKSKIIEIFNEDKVLIEIINPIIYFNKTIGAISLSGNCENIREYSKLVIVAFELLLEQQGNFIKKLNLRIANDDLKFDENSVIGKILEESMGEELLNTLLVYINNNGERNRVAGELHIHRNTLNYRLNKIEEITGLSFGNYVDLREYVTAYIEYLEIKIKNNI